MYICSWKMWAFFTETTLGYQTEYSVMPVIVLLLLFTFTLSSLVRIYSLEPKTVNGNLNWSTQAFASVNCSFSWHRNLDACTQTCTYTHLHTCAHRTQIRGTKSPLWVTSLQRLKWQGGSCTVRETADLPSDCLAH